MKHSEQTDALFEALTSAAGYLENPLAAEEATVPTKSGGRYSYRYAGLPMIVAQVRQVLADYKLAVVQETVSEGASVGIATRIIHASGQWIETGPLWLPAGEGPQQAGSALTYARRYSLLAALLLAADEDDDATSVRRTSDSATPSHPKVAQAGRELSPSPPVAESATSAPPVIGSGGTAESGSGVAADGEAAAAPDPGQLPHDAVWIQSPKVKSMVVCEVPRCVLHPARRKDEAVSA